MAFPLSGKSRPESSKGMGSGHTELASLAYDLYCPKGPTLRRDLTSALPDLKCLIFLEQGGPTFSCPTLSFLTGSYKLGSWSWAPSEILMRKERYPPSFSFLPDQIHKHNLMPFSSTCFLLPSISLLPHSPPLDQVTGFEPRIGVVFQ